MPDPSSSCALLFDERRILVSPWLGYLRLRSSGPEIIEAGGYHFDLFESNPFISLDKNPVGLILPDHYAATGCSVSFIWNNNYSEQRANPYTIDLSLPAEVVPSSTTIVDESRVDVESLVNVTPISGNATIDYAGAVYPTPREFEASFQMEASSIMTDLVNPCPFRLVQTVRRPASGFLTMVEAASWGAFYEEIVPLAEGESWSLSLNELIPVTSVYETEVNPDAIYVLFMDNTIETSVGVLYEMTTTLFGGDSYLFFDVSGSTSTFEHSGIEISTVAWDGSFPDLTLIAELSYTELSPSGGGVIVRVGSSNDLWMLIQGDWT